MEVEEDLIKATISTLQDVLESGIRSSIGWNILTVKSQLQEALNNYVEEQQHD
ncbi:MAG: hypothetical protein M0P69_19375 [Bacteroidales bacterium]|jgi:hypothetical protein|nr:hypothetical protein [Bacteroidales bacterium]